MKNFTLKYSFQKILLLNSLLVFALFGLLPKLSYASSAIAVGSNIFSSTRVGTHLYVNNAGSNTVSVIDTATNAVVDTIVVGSFPISSTLVGSDLYVNNESSGTVSVIDTGSNTVINTISAGVGNHPFSSTLVGSDLYVNNFLSNDISVIDTNSANLSYNTVTTTISILPETHPNTSTLIGSDLYVNDEGSNSVSVIDTNSLNVTHTIPVGSSPESFTATGSDLYVNNAGADTVSVIDMGTYSVVATIPVGSSPLFSILVGSDLYVNNDGDSSISIIDTGSNTVINTISAGVGRNHPFSSTLVGSDLYVDNTSSNNVSVIDVNSADTSYNTVIKNIDVQNNPRSSTLVGTDLYVNNNSSNNVSVIDTSTNTIVIVSPPSLLTEEINGTTLTMTFDESLDTSSIPDVGDFTVDVNNNPVTILSVNVVGTTVVLTLTNPVIYSDNVNVTYTVGSNPIQDLGGFQAISFSTNTSNSTPAPTASNVLVSGIPNVGEQLTGTYDYSDANGDLQGVSTFQWHRNGALIDGATTDKYTLTRDDSGTTIIFDVTPVSQSNVSGYSADSNGTLINSFPSISPYIDKYDFNGTDAGNPSGSLIQGPNDPISGDEELYGMAPNGGINGPGVIFRYDPIANTFTDLHDFDGNDGGYPAGSLIQGPNDPISGDTELYGMAYEGGQFGWGVIFQYDVTTGVYTVKYNFNLPSGGYPSSSLVQGPNDPISGDTEFYGTASQGGAIGNNGVIFQYDLTSNTYTDEHNFNGTDGSYPSGSLSLGPDGKFYGMTQSGGINGSGNIFQYDSLNNIVTDKYDLSDPSGVTPEGSLTLNTDGKFYGMTSMGGVASQGNIFEYDPINNIFSDKYDFNYPLGNSSPLGDLTLGADGKFYGMTESGGTVGQGNIFQYDPTVEGPNAYVNEYNFNDLSGDSPFGNLFLATDGKFYGMTQSGGINGSGNIFQFFIPIYITGTPAVSQTLTGHYAYFDAENDLEGASIFQWYRNGTPISGATTTTYSLTVADAGTVITFGVTPVALTGSTPGNEVQSIGLSISSSSIPSTPVITENKVSGSGIVYGCKDPAALNYNSFSSNKPSLCQYANNTASNTQTITTSPASSFSFTRILKYSMTGADVKTLQIYLNTHGYPVATVGVGSLNHETTYFGLKTKGAVIKFQKANKLIPDGIVGPKTRALIK